jgi:hypothetical protein
MVPAFRYHLLTLVAIFLALGIGMVIGSTYVQGAIVERLTRRLDDLNARFTTEIVPLREENRRKADFISALVPVILQNRLTGANVAIVQTGDYPETTFKVRETLTQAGATINSTLLIPRDFADRLSDSLPAMLPKLRAAHPGLTAEKTAIMRLMATMLAKGVPESDLKAFAEAGLLEYEGDFTRANNFIVLVCGASEESENRAEQVDKPLIQALKQMEITVVAVEPEQVGISYITALQQSGITTIDNADTDMGRIALALALRGERGDYGIKRTARSGLLPPLSPR